MAARVPLRGCKLEEHRGLGRAHSLDKLDEHVALLDARLEPLLKVLELLLEDEVILSPINEILSDNITSI